MTTEIAAAQTLGALTTILDCHTPELGNDGDYEGGCACGWTDIIWRQTMHSRDARHLQHVAEMLVLAGVSLDIVPITGDRVQLTVANMPQVVAWVRDDGSNWADPMPKGITVSIGHTPAAYISATYVPTSYLRVCYGDWLVRLGDGYTTLTGAPSATNEPEPR